MRGGGVGTRVMEYHFLYVGVFLFEIFIGLIARMRYHYFEFK